MKIKKEYLIIGAIAVVGFMYIKKIAPFDKPVSQLFGSTLPITGQVSTALPSGLVCQDLSTPGASGLCANGLPGIMPVAQCVDTSIPNPTTGLCHNGATPVIPSIVCADGSAFNTVTNRCANGQLGIPTASLTTTPNAGQIAAGNLSANPAGIINTSSGGAMQPQTPNIQPDSSVMNTFQKGLYEQLFTPYAAQQAGLVPNSQVPYAGPTAPGTFVEGKQVPILGGDVPPGTVGPNTNLYNYYPQLANQFGMVPPGGGTSGTDVGGVYTLGGVCFDNSTPNAATGLCRDGSLPTTGSGGQITDTSNTPVGNLGNAPSTNCFKANNIQYCESNTPDASCKTIAGVSYCPTTSSPSDCFDSGGVQFCKSTSPAADCIMVSGVLYCPAAPPIATTQTPCVQNVACIQGDVWDHNQCACVPGTQLPPPQVEPPVSSPPVSTPPPQSSQCFNNNGIVYCQTSIAVSSSCITLNGLIYCPVSGPTPPPTNTPSGPVPTIPPTSPTPTPTPTPLPTPPPSVPIGSSAPSLNCAVCKNDHQYTCHSECSFHQNMTSSRCLDCLAVCGSYDGMCPRH